MGWWDKDCAVGTMDDFAGKMKQKADALKQGTNLLKRRVAVVALQTCISATPVGNKTLWRQPDRAPRGYVGGRARANWFVGLGGPSTEMTEDTAGDALGVGQSAINGSQPGESIHINNNLPYIVPLNEGHSLQAPAGFVEMAVQTAREAIKSESIFTE